MQSVPNVGTKAKVKKKKQKPIKHKKFYLYNKFFIIMDNITLFNGLYNFSYFSILYYTILHFLILYYTISHSSSVFLYVTLNGPI